jgi:DNA (cytosine-5)-methyltransferase 1
VFIISDFGGESCDEVLAVTESLRGHPAPRREARQNAAADAGGGFTPGSFGGYEPGVGTLRSEGGDLGGGSETLAVEDRQWPADVAGTLDAHYGDKWGLEDQHVFGQDGSRFVRGCDVYNGEETGETAATVTSATGIANASGPKVMAVGLDEEQNGDVELFGTLKAREKGGGFEGSVCSWNGDETPKSSEEVCLTLRAGQGGEGVGVAHSLTVRHDSSEDGTGRGTPIIPQDNLTVRRLTPRECERLQGFPDDWTLEKAEVELVGNEWKATGKVAKQADGPRYKQLGNAVTVNVAAWFGGRLANVEEVEGELQV